MGAVQHVELLLLKWRQLRFGDAGRVTQPLQANLQGDPGGRIAAGSALLQNDPAQGGRQVGEVIAGPGCLASRTVDGGVRAALRAGEQLAEDIQQLVTALEV